MFTASRCDNKFVLLVSFAFISILVSLLFFRRFFRSFLDESPPVIPAVWTDLMGHGGRPAVFASGENQALQGVVAPALASGRFSFSLSWDTHMFS